VALIAKKRSLDAPAKILLAGAEHLRNLQSESNCNATAKSDFHLELLRLRQNWRLKKVSWAPILTKVTNFCNLQICVT
jgi:mediator of RNA polymerase II transcription subunit 17